MQNTLISQQLRASTTSSRQVAKLESLGLVQRLDNAAVDAARRPRAHRPVRPGQAMELERRKDQVV